MNYDTIKEEIKDIDITLPPPQEEPERQYYFIKKLQHWMELKKEEKGRELTCCVNTFGCQCIEGGREDVFLRADDHWSIDSVLYFVRRCSDEAIWTAAGDMRSGAFAFKSRGAGDHGDSENPFFRGERAGEPRIQKSLFGETGL